MQPKAQPISITVAPKNKKGLETLLYVTLLLANSINIIAYAYGRGSRILVDSLVACLLILLLYKLLIHFNVHVHQSGMIPFSGLSRFSGHFGGDGPSPLNRDTTVVQRTRFLRRLTLFTASN